MVSNWSNQENLSLQARHLCLQAVKKRALYHHFEREREEGGKDGLSCLSLSFCASPSFCSRAGRFVFSACNKMEGGGKEAGRCSAARHWRLLGTAMKRSSAKSGLTLGKSLCCDKSSPLLLPRLLVSLFFAPRNLLCFSPFKVGVSSLF